MAVDTGLYCLEVGQASCAVIIDRIPGRDKEYQAAIIDVGGNGKLLATWLRRYGVTRIVAVALTHHDSDHVCGLGQLVEGFKGRIDTVWILPDRQVHPKRLWIPSQKWLKDGAVRQIKRLEAPAAYPPGFGERLVGPDETEYALFCIYPTVYDVESVVHNAPRTGAPLGKGPNAVSAVLRIAIPSDGSATPYRTHVLLGGDLDYLGWNQLVTSAHDLNAHIFVVPHHGGPASASATFGAKELVAAVRPTSALVSVGTDKNSGPKPYGHPHKDLVQALRTSGANILCTQITPQCIVDPTTIPGGAVLARGLSEPVTCSSGVACAGTIVVRLAEDAAPVVNRLADHVAAVNKLEKDGHSPICR